MMMAGCWWKSTFGLALGTIGSSQPTTPAPGIRRATIDRLIRDHPKVDIPETVLDLLQQWGSESHPGRRTRKPPVYGRMASTIVDLIASVEKFDGESGSRPGSIPTLEPADDVRLLWRAATSA